MAYASITMDASSVLDGRALAQTGAVTFNGTSGSLPTSTIPYFTDISKTNNSVTVVLSTVSNVLLTLQSSPDLSPSNWTTIATNTPSTNTWTFIDTSATGTESRFYRAFITP
jgi:hypothetical protein